MRERTKRISLRILSVLSMEPEPDLHTGSGSDRLRNTASSTDIFLKTVLWIWIPIGPVFRALWIWFRIPNTDPDPHM